jgi:redox-sensitive bicupin YhaK (pirin superfamily)
MLKANSANLFMKTTIQRSSERGKTSTNWLNSNHSFSFGDYNNPEKNGFGLLRVLNDDEIAPGKGFETHPHSNMEIISIPLEGALIHQDSEGNQSSLNLGEIQIMSAGTGIKHSEFNASAEQPCKFLQIWIEPQKQNLQPSYAHKEFDPEDFHNHFATIVSPNRKHGSLLIHQEAWVCLGLFDQWYNLDYHMRGGRIRYNSDTSGNGAYLFVIEGSVEVNGENLLRRDAMEITETGKFNLTALEPNTQLLIIEVPLK